MTEKFQFAVLPDGREVEAYKITNSFGEYAVILNLGAAIQGIWVLDREGKIGPVVLGPDPGTDPAAYRRTGYVMGRCANRIAYGRFEIDGKTYQLKTPRGDHHLHGADGNFSKQLFTGELIENGVVLTLHDSGEDGWECGARVQITYTFGDDHALTLDYQITAEGNTVLSPTNHAYFNLEMPRDVLDTKVKLYTDTYAPKSPLGMPDGTILKTAGTPLDFTEEHTIREGLASDTDGFFTDEVPGYDDFYVVPGEGMRKIAEAKAPSNGRHMTVYSDAESLIFFTPTRDHQKVGEYELDGYTSFCMEMQFVPNAVNCPQYCSPVFRTGETLHTRTSYVFDIV
ncbi:MAG: galactose mutarotase [Lachnospiraceae bacterium]|nr:galactose mutarotase [Lachnospiraceae bacterium]